MTCTILGLILCTYFELLFFQEEIQFRLQFQFLSLVVEAMNSLQYCTLEWIKCLLWNYHYAGCDDLIFLCRISCMWCAFNRQAFPRVWSPNFILKPKHLVSKFFAGVWSMNFIFNHILPQRFPQSLFSYKFINYTPPLDSISFGKH